MQEHDNNNNNDNRAANSNDNMIGQQYSTNARAGQRFDAENISWGSYDNTKQETISQPDNNRALAMVLYWTGIIGLIMGLIVCDRSDEFVKFHLNQALVLCIATIVSSFLTIVLIGFLLLIVVFVFYIIATVDAYHGQTKELPLLGKIHIL